MGVAVAGASVVGAVVVSIAVSGVRFMMKMMAMTTITTMAPTT